MNLIEVTELLKHPEVVKDDVMFEMYTRKRAELLERLVVDIIEILEEEDILDRFHDDLKLANDDMSEYDWNEIGAAMAWIQEVLDVSEEEEANGR